MEDILQETVLRLWEFDQEGLDGSYLQHKANFLIIDAVRVVLADSRKLEKPVFVSTEAMPESRLLPDTNTSLEEKLLLELLIKEYDAMKPNEAKIIDASINDESMRSLASNLGRTEASVSMRLKGLKDRFTKILLGE
jgi:DNA-directed RNA polymerase specialized sigma24 family protein